MKQKNIKIGLQEYFFMHPSAKLRVRQIERIVGIPLPSVIRYAQELQEEQILTTLTIGGIKLYAADRVSPIFLLQKRLFNIERLYKCGLIEHLIQTHYNPTIILFGSYVRGEDIETSDIDLFVITPKNGFPREGLGQFAIFEKKLGRRLQFFAGRTIHSIKNKELKNNILNGIVLNGFLEVFQ